MIQDIAPSTLDNQMHFAEARPNDLLMVFRNDPDRPGALEVLLREEGGAVSLPSCQQLQGDEAIYALCIDEARYFLAMPGHGIWGLEGFSFARTSTIRTVAPKQTAFAVVTGLHLYQWYRDNRFCGRCGAALTHSTTERALACNACGNIAYPKISPVVIVAVTWEDRLLLTRYAGRRGTHRALVAGYIEIGETPEQAVAREVMEECGLHVKDVRYVMSQPWGFDGNLLLGFTAKLDGSPEIEVDGKELASAEWVRPEEIFEEPDGISLTNELMMRFKRGEM